MLPLLAVVIGVVAFEAAAVLTSTTLCAKKSKASHSKNHKKGKKYKAEVHPEKKDKKRYHVADVDVSPAIEAAVQRNCWGCSCDGGGGGGDGGGGGGGGGGCGGGG